MAKNRIEFGDFQTPGDLAESVIALLRALSISPSIIVEPTCGLGSFVRAAIKGFPTARQVFAFDINPEYISGLSKSPGQTQGCRFQATQQDFFTFDWTNFFKAFPDDILVIGNPPWVTNSTLGALGGDNLPRKTNFQNHPGFAARTGKANFDISEWIMIKLLESLNNHRGCLAMLCKIAAARKVLRYAWINRLNIGRTTIHQINAAAHFGVAVEACLLIVHIGDAPSSPRAGIYDGLNFDHPVTTCGLIGNDLVADIKEYENLRDIDGLAYYTWRSGVKHDAASVMELKCEDNVFSNGTNERIDLESTYIYPLLKSSDIANGRLIPHRYMIVTQRNPSAGTEIISRTAPKTWTYLMRHADILDRRQSIIYKKRARFSVFGVGDYTFSPWKIAISGLYKNLRFEMIGKYRDKPVVFDDTCYFIPCGSEIEASFVYRLFNSDIVQRFLRSLVFFDAKRPITIDKLNRIDLNQVARRLGLENEAKAYLRNAATFEDRQSAFVFAELPEYQGNESRIF